jgi:hypothetical protein
MGISVNGVNIEHISMYGANAGNGNIIEVKVNNQLVWERPKVYINSASVAAAIGNAYVITPSPAVHSDILYAALVKMYIFIEVYTFKNSYQFTFPPYTEYGGNITLYNGNTNSYTMQAKVLPGPTATGKIQLTPGRMLNGEFVAGQYDNSQSQNDAVNLTSVEVITGQNAMWYALV